MYIDELNPYIINGKKQYLSIRSEKEGAPILLYLHGGPGDAALPQMLKYNKELENHYTVVIWEQRGAGLSYYPFGKDNMTIQTFVEDAHAIILLLLKRFKKEKVYLLAHSWGTVIGLQLIKQHPALVHTYTSCGQVVNMAKSCKLQCDFLHEKFQGDHKLIQKLKSIDCTYATDDWVDDLLFVTKNVIRYKGSIYGKSNYNQYYLDFLSCKKYSFRNMINRIKGSDQSIKYLWQELMKMNFEDDKEFQVPVVFMVGQHDYHVSAKLAKNYYDSIITDKQIYMFEKSGHNPHWEEADKFNRITINLLTHLKGENSESQINRNN